MASRHRISSTSSREYKTVLRCHDTLVTVVQNNLSSFTSQCLSCDLISEETERYTLTTGIADSYKAQRIVDSIRDSIKNVPTRFNLLLNVLRSFPSLEGEVQILLEEYGKHTLIIAI